MANTKSNKHEAQESGLATAAYWLILLAAFLAAVSALELEIVFLPLELLVTGMFDYAPQLICIGVLLLVVWLIMEKLSALDHTMGKHAQGLIDKIMEDISADRLERAELNLEKLRAMRDFLPEPRQLQVDKLEEHFESKAAVTSSLEGDASHSR